MMNPQATPTPWFWNSESSREKQDQAPLPDPIYMSQQQALEMELCNRALRLAESNNFMEMCRVSLLGNEADPDSDEYAEFGRLVRSLVEHYLPETPWQLRLLSYVADASWKLERLRKLQSSIYHAHNSKGKYGMSYGLELAIKFDDDIERQIKILNSAIGVYRKSARKI